MDISQKLWCCTGVVLISTFIIAAAHSQEPFAIDAGRTLFVKTQPVQPPKPGERPEGRLSPELRALSVYGGQLVGKLKGHVAVLRFADEQQLKAAGEKRDVSKGLQVLSSSDADRASLEKFQRYIVLFDPKKSPTIESPQGSELKVYRRNNERGRVTFEATAPLSATTLENLLKVAAITYIEPSYEVRIPPEPAKEEGNQRNPVPHPLNPAQPPPQQPGNGASSSPENLRAESTGSSPGVIESYSASARSITPNDGDWARLWGMRNIHAPDAWDSVTRSVKIVAVIDSGVQMTHRDLAANIWTNVNEVPGDGIDNDGNGFVDDVHGYDFHDNDSDPDDQNSHGTHCAGTIGAVGNDMYGVCGVFWRGQIMPVRFLGADGSGSNDDAIECIEYAVNNGATILSNSWGGGGYSQGLADAIEYAKQHGVIFVAAAGNDSTDTDTNPHYPSSYNSENVVAVLNIMSNDTISPRSNFGGVSVDLGAPGTNIWSTVPPVLSTGNTHGYKSGTSMATPHVSGACALIWSHPDHGGRSWKEIIGLVLTNTRSLASLSSRCVTGGTLDLRFLAPPIPAAGEAYRSFASFTLRSAANVDQIQFKLDERMYVHITAAAQATLDYPTRGKGFVANFSTSGALNDVIPRSGREITISSRNDSVTVSSSMGLRLDPGVHTIYWQIRPRDTRGCILQLENGTIMVEAFGRKLGGDLP